jgi:hypothetical protein
MLMSKLVTHEACFHARATCGLNNAQLQPSTSALAQKLQFRCSVAPTPTCVPLPCSTDTDADERNCNHLYW